MGQLFNTIRQLVAEEKYVVGLHASERIRREASSRGAPQENGRANIMGCSPE